MTASTWIVVADGARGRVFAWSRRDKALSSPLGQDFVASRLRVRDRVSDRGGQTLERAGEGGHAKGKSQDSKEHDQQVLAREIARALNGARNNHAVEELVLVAPPAFLGLLRKELDGPTAKLVIASHHKDLSSLPQHELVERVPELLEP